MNILELIEGRPYLKASSLMYALIRTVCCMIENDDVSEMLYRWYKMCVIDAIRIGFDKYLGGIYDHIFDKYNRVTTIKMRVTQPYKYNNTCCEISCRQPRAIIVEIINSSYGHAMQYIYCMRCFRDRFGVIYPFGAIDAVDPRKVCH